MFTVAHTVQYLENTILDKNVKKNARYMFNFRILPSKARFTQDTPPSPQKNNVEVWPEHFCCLLNNIDQGGVGGGVTMVPNTQGGSPVCKKEQNSKHFLSKIGEERTTKLAPQGWINELNVIEELSTTTANTDMPNNAD